MMHMCVMSFPTCEAEVMYQTCIHVFARVRKELTASKMEGEKESVDVELLLLAAVDAASSAAATTLIVLAITNAVAAAAAVAPARERKAAIVVPN
mmetsp:Transcript_30729/g.62267  ORF Transcript_30729/g.62267 Transcript_30729/m.62267 type:complete len:95 (-) Transcript_30729:1540-1824(-)